jgi:HK97 gp10 family phage protein
MRPTLKIKGFDELEKKMERLSKALPNRTQRKIESSGAEILLREMEALIPVRTGALREDLDIVVNAGSVTVGPSGQTAFRAHFLEFGTVNHAAQPFIRPAFDNTEGRIKADIKSSLRSEINKAKG